MVCLHAGTMGVILRAFLSIGQGKSLYRSGISPGNTPSILCIFPFVAHQLASARKKTRVAKLTGDTVAPTSRDRRPGHGGSAAASAAPRAASPTSLAALASPPHSPDATPSLPPAGAASPSPRSPAPSPSRPDPARPAADHWTDARGSDG